LLARAPVDCPQAEKADLERQRAREDADEDSSAFATAEGVRESGRAGTLRCRACADHNQLKRDRNHPENAVHDRDPRDDVEGGGERPAARIRQRVGRHRDRGDAEGYCDSGDAAGIAIRKRQGHDRAGRSQAASQPERPEHARFPLRDRIH
jgi:hypothetical protein